MLGYFGPEGTFTHQALRTVTDAEARPLASVQGVLNAVRSGEIEAGLVPIENSVEGGVTATLDNLATGDPLVIVQEVLLPVAFVLAVRPGTAMGDVRRVITHPHAHAQTRDWVLEHLPQATVTEGGSTAGAAEEVARPDSRFDAAICARVAADLYGLECLATDIADNPDAVTRFVMVRRPGVLPEPTGADKTTLVAYMFADHSGALLDILQQFAMRGVNLTRIESRPTKKAFGGPHRRATAAWHAQGPAPGVPPDHLPGLLPARRPGRPQDRPRLHRRRLRLRRALDRRPDGTPTARLSAGSAVVVAAP